MTMDEARARARVLKALGHPARLMILDILSNGDACACDLYPRLKMQQPTLSRHLAFLKQAGLIFERRAGPRVVLHLAQPIILRALQCAAVVAKADHLRRSSGVRGP